MNLFNNKKGIASGLIIVVFTLFVIAVSNLLSLFLMNQLLGAINDLPADTGIDDSVKQKIADLPFINWGDKLFVYSFVFLLIAYLITAANAPTEKGIYIILFIGYIIFVTILAMILSNAYDYISNIELLQSTANSLKFTDYFMKYLPFVSVIAGAIGAITFYSRKRSKFSTGGENLDFE